MYDAPGTAGNIALAYPVKGVEPNPRAAETPLFQILLDCRRAKGKGLPLASSVCFISLSIVILPALSLKEGRFRKALAAAAANSPE